MVYDSATRELQTWVEGELVMCNEYYRNRLLVYTQLVSNSPTAVPPPGEAILYLDVATGDLRIRFDTGNEVTIATYT